MELLKNHLKATRKNEILWLVFSKITFLPLAILIAFLITGFLIILILFFLVCLVLYLTTFSIWRDHLNKRFGEASRFIEILESKTDTLKKTFQDLFRTQLPKNVYWIDFEIDPTSFEIKTLIHSTEPNSSIDISTVENSLTDLLKVDKSIIMKYKKTGWEADDNIQLSLELAQRWFTKVWVDEVSDEYKIRATFSVMSMDGHLDLKSGKWEDTSVFFGKPLQ
ncbi:MAG: hypothetical protein JNM78_18700 [Cyclobacteriaceae bacterium]|nr:hypothetical protein [Cyclobacteriaceae bacterium]